MSAVPVFICVRDRVTDLRRLVAWLEKADSVERIVLIDNASTWPPLLEYLAETDHEVVRLDDNVGKMALWRAGLMPEGRYVYTDPDVVPIDSCPTDAITVLSGVLDDYPGWPKAGLGLHLDDLPPTMPSLVWEHELISPLRRMDGSHHPCPLYGSLIDTTFAMYREGRDFCYEAVRTGHPYSVRHSSWYADPEHLSDEDRYYLDHAATGSEGSSWKEMA